MSFKVLIFREDNNKWNCKCLINDIWVEADDPHQAYDSFINQLIKDSYYAGNDGIGMGRIFTTYTPSQKYLDMWDKARIVRETDFLKVRLLQS